MNNIFDAQFNGMGRSEMYRALIVPEVFPHEKPMLVENWHPEDLEAYCGGHFTPGYRYRHFPARHLLGAQ